MAEFESPMCAECEGAFDYPAPPPVSRRNFLKAVGTGVAGIAAAANLRGAEAKPDPVKKPRPAEELVKELVSGLDEAQKKRVVKPYNDKLRTGMFNAPVGGVRLEEVYKKPQLELIERIVKAMSSGDDGFRQISRGGTWDASKAFEKTGAMIFGDPLGKDPFAFVFAGHHLTIRCDGNFKDGIAFGGPIYYGHTPYGYSPANIFNYQTKAVLSVYEALDEKQKEVAVVKLPPPARREHAPSIQFRKKAEERPGILLKDMTKDQQALVEKVMREILKPFRKEDCDEVMDVIKATGGMEAIKLAFCSEAGKPTSKKEQWHFWRLEGPGFVWNYRVLDHVHTYVNISSKLA
jgi:hypothetical protein